MLEQAIQENTLAVKQLNELLQHALKNIGLSTALEKSVNVESDAKTSTLEDLKATKGITVDLETIRTQASSMTISLAKKQREIVVNLLDKYGAKNVKGIEDSKIENYFNELSKLERETSNVS